MYEARNSNYKTVLNYLVGTLLSFGLLNWPSYHNGLAYDGLITIRFPLTYYNEGAGQSLASGKIEHFNNFSLLALTADLACSFQIYLGILLLFKILRRKS